MCLDFSGNFFPRKFGLTSPLNLPAFVEFKHKLLSEWGEQGWELVAGHNGLEYALKRPKS